jgi:hypothetical protein
MSPKNEKKTVSPKGGFTFDLTQRIKLIIRLMADPRVNPLIKVLPIGAVFYVLLFPDLAPGPIDDAAVLWLGTYLFVELCPPEVVQEHMKALEQVVHGEWHDPSDEEDVIDAEYWEAK